MNNQVDSAEEDVTLKHRPGIDVVYIDDLIQEAHPNMTGHPFQRTGLIQVGYRMCTQAVSALGFKNARNEHFGSPIDNGTNHSSHSGNAIPHRGTHVQMRDSLPP